MPKRIDFADIKVGDTIRVVDVVDMVITERHEHEIRSVDDEGNGSIYLEKSPRIGVNRKFQLVDRPVPTLPTKLGSVLELHNGAGTWILIYEVTRGKSIWVNTHNGVRQSVAFMQQRVASAGGFEVIL